MLSITHAMTGAYIASLCPDKPYLYIPIALAAHYLEDSVPHFDGGMVDHSHSKVKMMIVGAIDLLIAAGLVWWTFQEPIKLSQFSDLWHLNWPIWFGALAGILPDIIEIPHSFLGKSPKILKPFFYLHKKFHRKLYHWFWGLLPQILIVGSIIYIIKNGIV